MRRAEARYRRTRPGDGLSSGGRRLARLRGLWPGEELFPIDPAGPRRVFRSLRIAYEPGAEVTVETGPNGVTVRSGEPAPRGPGRAAPRFVMMQTEPHPDHWTQPAGSEATPVPQAVDRYGERYELPADLRARIEERAYIDLVARQAAIAEDRARAPRDAVAEYGRAEDLTGTLVDLARAGQREDFRDLAVMSGVGPEEIAPMWRGTRRRLGLGA